MLYYYDDHDLGDGTLDYETHPWREMFGWMANNVARGSRVWLFTERHESHGLVSFFFLRIDKLIGVVGQSKPEKKKGQKQQVQQIALLRWL